MLTDGESLLKGEFVCWGTILQQIWPLKKQKLSLKVKATERSLEQLAQSKRIEQISPHLFGVSDSIENL